MIIREGKPMNQVNFVVEGKINAYKNWSNFGAVHLEAGGPLPEKVYTPFMSFADECLFKEEYKAPYTLISKDVTHVLTLNKKDFSEVLYYRRVE